MSPFTPGARLHHRFILEDRIGTGGMSQVWRATDQVLGRPVAVKTLDAELADDPGLREATWREARAAARLTHPNVTRVYDYGEAPLPGGGAAPYLMMELVEGESLASRLAAGPLPWPEAARVGAYVALGVALSRSDAPEASGGPGGSGPVAPSPQPSPTPPASTAPADARAVLDTVDQAIRDVRGDGSLDPDTAEKLTDKLEDVTKELEKRNGDAGKQAEKVRDKADDLREEIVKEQEKGKLSAPLATELQSLLDPLDDLLG